MLLKFVLVCFLGQMFISFIFDNIMKKISLLYFQAFYTKICCHCSIMLFVTVKHFKMTVTNVFYLI